MEPEKLQKMIDGSMPSEDVSYIFAAFDPATGHMIMVRRGDIGICTTMQMHIAAHIVQQLQEAMPPQNNLRMQNLNDDPLMRPASEN